MAMTIQLMKPYYSEESRRGISQGIDEILASGTLMFGPWTDRFETLMRDTAGASHAVSVNTCTTALTIALMYYGVDDGEVLVPSGSFLTDVSAILFAGGTPVLVDMNPATLSFDLDDLRRKINGRTKGIIWVHLTGMISPEYEEILEIARGHGLFVIEDASHAHGAFVEGRKAGSLGDAACFSFYPTKIVSSGTGGVLTTNDEKLKRFAEEMRIFGKDQETGEVVRLGNDWFMDEFRACIGYHHLTELPIQVDRRRTIAERYGHLLANQPGLALLSAPDGNAPSWYQYAVFINPAVDRSKLGERLKAGHGIDTKSIYRPTHREQIFRHLDDGSLAKTEDTLRRSLCLPMFFELADELVETISAALIEEVRALL